MPANPLILKRPASVYTAIVRDPFAPDQRTPQGEELRVPGVDNLLHRRGARGFGIKNYTEPNWADLEQRAVSRASRPDLTVLERIFLRELFRRGMVEGIDFISQLQLAGGRHVPGGYLPDFTILLHGPIAVEVDGDAWHSGLEANTSDVIKASYEHSLGFVEVLRIDEGTLRYDDLTQRWFHTYLPFIGGTNAPRTSAQQFYQGLFSGTYGPNAPLK